MSRDKDMGSHHDPTDKNEELKIGRNRKKRRIGTDFEITACGTL